MDTGSFSYKFCLKSDFMVVILSIFIYSCDVTWSSSITEVSGNNSESEAI